MAATVGNGVHLELPSKMVSINPTVYECRAQLAAPAAQFSWSPQKIEPGIVCYKLFFRDV